MTCRATNACPRWRCRRPSSRHREDAPASARVPMSARPEECSPARGRPRSRRRLRRRPRDRTGRTLPRRSVKALRRRRRLCTRRRDARLTAQPRREGMRGVTPVRTTPRGGEIRWRRTPVLASASPRTLSRRLRMRHRAVGVCCARRAVRKQMVRCPLRRPAARRRGRSRSLRHQRSTRLLSLPRAVCSSSGSGGSPPEALGRFPSSSRFLANTRSPAASSRRTWSGCAARPAA